MGESDLVRVTSIMPKPQLLATKSPWGPSSDVEMTNEPLIS